MWAGLSHCDLDATQRAGLVSRISSPIGSGSGDAGIWALPAWIGPGHGPGHGIVVWTGERRKGWDGRRDGIGPSEVEVERGGIGNNE